jgi:hypothetical protein
VSIDAEGVDEGSQAIVEGENDGEAPPIGDPLAKVLGGVNVGVDDEDVGEAPSCRCISGGESSWFAMTICEDPPAKVFGGREVGVDVEGDGKGPPAKLYGEGEVGVDAEGDGEGPLAKLFDEGPHENRCFGRGNVGEVTEDGGEARHAEGDANVGTDAACRRLEKSHENERELISCII